jgi:hypothetical protein
MQYPNPNHYDCLEDYCDAVDTYFEQLSIVMKLKNQRIPMTKIKMIIQNASNTVNTINFYPNENKAYMSLLRINKKS